ncbi:aminoglycoside phosphotransferase family protein [Holospora curviuscula]|uniref:Aminoglycoside/hydroxyurea antibiotic resistance kinase n=1 Tax=Holospora curviuscula TaxID=1082868 RepID=A0A2S5R7X0_9PROT|nr:aminoglycoside phosphotransferase family protein [Holospora curviuscula]PPE03400.1 Aminoglycoside/hydroxyurea antibiotic resistance kinase [Holospora curviuscula]
MNTFHSNIISIYGEKGKAWLDALPELVAAIASRLDLRDLKEVTNLTYNYVLSGFQGDNPIILKASLDSEGLAREAFALKCFAGYGAVKVLVEDNGMLLLERAIPGVSLKSYFPNQEHESIEIACGVMKKLHQENIPKDHPFPHIKDPGYAGGFAEASWLAALDKDCLIPDGYLQKARKLRGELLQTSKPDVFLHGDLHHDNILQNGDDWMVIDPKGVIGEPAYEVAAFIRNPIPELLHHADATTIIHNRITQFSELLGIPAKRILDWCFVQAVLAWAWALEDGCDISYFELTKIFDVLRPFND